MGAVMAISTKSRSSSYFNVTLFNDQELLGDKNKTLFALNCINEGKKKKV